MTNAAGRAWPLPAVVAAILCAALLASCGQSDDDPGPGGVTVGEARALDEAAAMLDAQRLPPPEATADAPVEPPAAAETPSAAR